MAFTRKQKKSYSAGIAKGMAIANRRKHKAKRRTRRYYRYN